MTGGKRLLRLRLVRWLVFLVSVRWVVTLFTELVQRLTVAMVAASAVGKEFMLGSRLLDLGTSGSTGTSLLFLPRNLWWS
jgi:hypothetical protein